MREDRLLSGVIPNFYSRLRAKFSTQPKSIAPEVSAAVHVPDTILPRTRKRSPYSPETNPGLYEKAEQSAAECIEILNARPGEGSVVMIVDDEDFKRDLLEELLRKQAAQRGVTPAITQRSDVRSAVIGYEKLRKLYLERYPGRYCDIIMILDGRITGAISGDKENSQPRFGIEGADMMAIMSEENGWPMPLFVGGSTDVERNTELQQAYPEHYIATLRLSTESNWAQDVEIIGPML